MTIKRIPVPSAVRVRQFISFFPELAAFVDASSIVVDNNCRNSKDRTIEPWSEIRIPLKSFAKTSQINELFELLGKAWKIEMRDSGIKKVKSKVTVVAVVEPRSFYVA